MREEKRSKRRAVRLTPEGLEILRVALAEGWREVGVELRLTRDRRAELMGVSVVTGDRILGGKGVDRSSLMHAFVKLGLKWEDSYCFPVDADAPAVSPPERTPESVPGPESDVPSNVEQGRAPKWFPLVAVATVGFAAMVVLSSVARPAQPAPVEDETVAARRQLTDLTRRGDLRFHAGDYAAAAELLNRAVQLARDHGVPGELATALRFQGDLQGWRGDYRDARTSYEESLSLWNALKKSQCLPPVNEALGDVATRMGDFTAAQKFLTDSLEGFRSENDLPGMAMAERNLGTLSYKQGRLEEADRWLQSALSRIKGQNKPDMETDIRGRQALVMGRRGRFDQARKTLEECLAYWTAKKHPRWIAVTKLQLGTIEEMAGDQPRSKKLLAEAEAEFEALGDRGGAAEAHSLLSQTTAP